MKATIPRILYLDEDQERGFRLSTGLRRENYETIATEFACDALQLASRLDFDLYLLSRRFPVESSTYLCKRLHELSPETPIVFFNNGETKLGADSPVLSGSAEYLVEPHNVNELVATVRRVLNEKKTKSRHERLVDRKKVSRRRTQKNADKKPFSI
jgi:DNA-binding response OmpR family regulator